MNKSKPEYRVWSSMKTRCNNPRSKSYANYGGRGVTVCEAWSHDFNEFLRDVGPRPSLRHTLDRINNNGNYEPGNCRWATRKQQNRNTRSNRILECDGERRPAAEWAELYKLSYTTLLYRIDTLKWEMKRALTAPLLTRSEYARGARGEDAGAAKLTAQKVAQIRAAYAEKKASQRQLALQYGVARRTIQRVVEGETWRG